MVSSFKWWCSWTECFAKRVKSKAILACRFSHWLFYGGEGVGRNLGVLRFIGHSSVVMFKANESNSNVIGEGNPDGSSSSNSCSFWGSALKCLQNRHWLIAKQTSDLLQKMAFQPWNVASWVLARFHVTLYKHQMMFYK